MKNKEDVFALKEKSQELYEKLSLLAFVEEYVNTTPNLEASKEELIAKVVNALETKNAAAETEDVSKPIVHQLDEEYLELDNGKLKAEIGDGFDKEDAQVIEKIAVLQESLEVEKEETLEQPFDDLEGLIYGDTKPTNFKDDPKNVGERNSPTLEEELEGTIPVDIMANLFEPTQPKSLNDRLAGNIQIGLNDRIVFVKNLFDGSQEDFNRVISQLNTIKTEKEANKFINKMVKPDYNWAEHEELETRFMEIVSRKFI
ncbi:hypothetical protein [uncultured Polaribacter sp.]|uniref:hypothetical protein n=1 Tax=uncultured Polaribacter sp. TaxID=174711 RepID=UPI00263505FC|nr:hypothetical protein [uncultured Polaribacter sp.]